MLQQSKLLDKLCNIFPYNNIIYQLYGDLAYLQSQFLLGGFRFAQPLLQEAA